MFFSAFLARRGTTFSMSWIVGPATLQWFVMAPWSKIVMPVQCRLKSLNVRAFGMGMVWYQLAWKLGCYSHPNVTTILATCLRCELQGTRVDPCSLGNYSNMSNILRSVKHEDLHRLDVLPRSSPWEIDQVERLPPSNSLHINGWLWDLWFHISTRLHGSTQKFAERRWFAHPAVSKEPEEISSNFFGTRSFQCARESGSFSDCFFPPVGGGRLKSGDTMTRGLSVAVFSTPSAHAMLWQWRSVAPVFVEDLAKQPPSNRHQFRCSRWCWRFPFVKGSRVGLCFEKVGVSMAEPSMPQWYHIHLPPLRPPCRNVVPTVVARGSLVNLVNLVNSAACRLVVCLKEIS